MPQFSPPLSTCGHRAEYTEYTESLGTKDLGVRWETQSSAGLPRHKHTFLLGGCEASSYQGMLFQLPTAKQLKTSVPCPGTMHSGT